MITHKVIVVNSKNPDSVKNLESLLNSGWHIESSNVSAYTTYNMAFAITLDIIYTLSKIQNS